MRNLTVVTVDGRTPRPAVRGPDGWLLAPAPRGGARDADRLAAQPFGAAASTLLDAVGGVPHGEPLSRITVEVDDFHGKPVVSVAVRSWWPVGDTCEWEFYAEDDGTATVTVRPADDPHGGVLHNVTAGEAAEALLVVAGAKVADASYATGKMSRLAAATARTVTVDAARALVHVAADDLPVLRLLARNSAVPDEASAAVVEALARVRASRSDDGWMPAAEIVHVLTTRPSVPPAGVQAAAGHDDAAVRAVAAAHPGCPPHARSPLRDDPDPTVAAAARNAHGH